ncbi:peroxisomal membrane protein pex14 [Basidiobolus ranarum]|uniref:Peroxisomal membrane protein PEX14 n=1 Tax=Basidiobolus ranarum TaxID=34480 RepID=A0ABR2WSW6_9FUNG
MSERKQLVDSAIKFLLLPQVQSKSLQQKKAFLNSKGLSSHEIEEALNHVETQQQITRDFYEDRETSLRNQNEKVTRESEAWDSAQILSPEDIIRQPVPEIQEKSRLDSWRNAITFTKPEAKHWKNYFTATVSALGGVYGVYELVKGFGTKKKEETSQPENLKNETTKAGSSKSIGLQPNETSLSAQNTAEQLAQVSSQTAALKDYVETLGASVKNLQIQETTRDQEFKSLSKQLDELQHSIPQMLESQKSAQYAMVAGLHDDLKALKNLLIRRNTPANSPQITAAQTTTQTQSNPFISSPLATKSK